MTPYAGSQELFHLVRGVDADKTPLPAQRSTLVFFRGHCGPWENVAKRMRHAMVAALRQQNTSDVDACCLGAPPGCRYIGLPRTQTRNLPVESRLLYHVVNTLFNWKVCTKIRSAEGIEG